MCVLTPPPPRLLFPYLLHCFNEQEQRSVSASVAWSASESEVANTLKAVASTATSQVVTWC